MPTDLDFLFPSVRFKGTKPLSPDSILEKSVRPALARIGVVGKSIGWHSFRHSLATNLRDRLGSTSKLLRSLCDTPVAAQRLMFTLARSINRSAKRA